jgi:hypothetical protein
MRVAAGSFDAHDGGHVDDTGPMHAQEGGRVELALELGQRLVFQPGAPLRMDRDVVVLGFDVIDAGRGHHVHARAIADQDALERRAALRRVPDDGPQRFLVPDLRRP